MAADTGAAWRTPSRYTRPELISVDTVEVDVAISAAGFVCAAGHVVTDATDRYGRRITVGVVLGIEGDSGQGSNVIDVLDMGTLATGAAKVITAAVVLAVTQIGWVGVATAAGTAGTCEGVAVVDSVPTMIVACAADRAAVVAIR